MASGGPIRFLRRVRRRIVLRGRPIVLATAATILRTVRPGPGTEERLLRWSWASRSAERLDDYLTIGWQNPRINVQSILVRHTLVRLLFGDLDAALMRQELEFAVQLNEALRLESLRTGIRINSYLDAQRQGRIRAVERVNSGREHVFEVRWRETLADRVRPGEAPRLSVLELACGSANDYRAFASFGIAPFLDYAGIDLNPKSIANARRRFPTVDFEVGNAMSVARPDRSADVVIVSDLFEHLPLDGASKVLAEATRIAGRAVILSFFNMAEIPEHDDRPTAAYRWNRLSRARYEETLRRAFPTVTVIPIPAWLEREFGYAHTYNPAAYTMVAERAESG